MGGDIGPEDCLNGVDDNGDGDVDCADSKCGDFRCVSAIPEAWAGYFVLFDGPPGMDPDCPASFPGTVNSFLGNGSLDAPPAMCNCSCLAPTGQTCNAPTKVTIYDATLNANCSELVPDGINCFAEPALGPANGSCFDTSILASSSTCGANGGATCSMGTSPCNVSAVVAAPTVTGGACAAVSGAPTVPNASWMNLGRGCGDPVAFGQGCNGTQVCLPRPEPPYESGVCISMAGDHDCPPGAFAEKHVFFEDFTDTRACTPCACGAPTGSTCSMTVTLYSAATCTAPTATFPAGGCANLTGNPAIRGRRLTLNQGPSGGSCSSSPSGGQPSGAATPSVATTFCCIP